jgi:hypothetical protein
VSQIFATALFECRNAIPCESADALDHGRAFAAVVGEVSIT